MWHLCVNKLGPNLLVNDRSRNRCQAIIWSNPIIVLIGSLGTNFSETWTETHRFSFTEINLKVSSARYRPSCVRFNVVIHPFADLGVTSSICPIWCTGKYSCSAYWCHGCLSIEGISAHYFERNWTVALFQLLSLPWVYRKCKQIVHYKKNQCIQG